MKEKLLKQKSKQAKYYNQKTKKPPPLRTGEAVRVAPKPGDRERKCFKAWVEYQVDIRSYEVKTEDGRLYRRNATHLRESKEPFVQTSATGLVRPSQDNQFNTAPAASEPTRPQVTGQPIQNNLGGQPKQTEPVTHSPSQEPPSGSVKPTVVTRSGRVSRPHSTYMTSLQKNKDFRIFTDCLSCFIVTELRLRQANRQTFSFQ